MFRLQINSFLTFATTHRAEILGAGSSLTIPQYVLFLARKLLFLSRDDRINLAVCRIRRRTRPFSSDLQHMQSLGYLKCRKRGYEHRKALFLLHRRHRIRTLHNTPYSFYNIHEPVKDKKITDVCSSFRLLSRRAKNRRRAPSRSQDTIDTAITDVCTGYGGSAFPLARVLGDLACRPSSPRPLCPFCALSLPLTTPMPRSGAEREGAVLLDAVPAREAAVDFNTLENWPLAARQLAHGFQRSLRLLAFYMAMENALKQRMLGRTEAQLEGNGRCRLSRLTRPPSPRFLLPFSLSSISFSPSLSSMACVPVVGLNEVIGLVDGAEGHDLALADLKRRISALCAGALQPNLSGREHVPSLKTLMRILQEWHPPPPHPRKPLCNVQSRQTRSVASDLQRLRRELPGFIYQTMGLRDVIVDELLLTCDVSRGYARHA